MHSARRRLCCKMAEFWSWVAGLENCSPRCTCREAPFCALIRATASPMRREGTTMRNQVFAAATLLSTLLGGAAAYAADPGTFQPVGSMAAVRQGATLNLLPDG